MQGLPGLGPRRVAVLGHGGAGVSSLAAGLRALGLEALDGGTALERAVALRAADLAVVVVSSPDGLHPATAALWDALGDWPRVVAVTRLDAERADFDESVAVCQRVLGGGVLPLTVPVQDDAGRVAGVLDLLALRLSDSSGGARVEREPDPEHVALVAGLRDDLVESVLAGAEDERLLDDYLDGAEPAAAVLAEELARGVARVELHPVLAVSVPDGVGLVELARPLLACPAPPRTPAVTRPDGSPAAPLTGDAGGPLAAEVLAVRVEPDGSRTARVLVRSGRLLPGTTLLAAGHGHAPAHDEATAVEPDGALCVVSGLRQARVADTLSAPDDPLLLEAWDLPEPTLPLALGGVDEVALARLAVEDPTVRLARGHVWVLDEAHAAAVVARLGAERGAVTPDEGPAVVRVHAPSWARRAVRGELTRRAATGLDVEDDGETAVLTATLTGRDLLTWAEDLARLTHGTGRTALVAPDPA